MMRNTFWKTIGSSTLTVLMTITIAHISLSAQEGVIAELKGGEQAQQEDRSRQRRNVRALEGVWDHINTRRDCVTGEAIQVFAVMHTYMRGGTMSDWGAGNPPSRRSNGQGIWNFESRGLYTTAFQFFRFNPDGTFAGKQVVREQIQLSRDGNSYEASATAQVFDVLGNVIANNCSTGAATRFE